MNTKRFSTSQDFSPKIRKFDPSNGYECFVMKGKRDRLKLE